MSKLTYQQRGNQDTRIPVGQRRTTGGQVLEDNRAAFKETAPLGVMKKNSPVADQQAQLAAMNNSNPTMTAQRNIVDGINSSPYVTAQRQRIDSLVGGSIRQQKEEPLLGKFETAQRVEESLPPNNTGLPDNLKNGIESLSGLSMDNVKVHYNSAKPSQLNALAYAQGTDIHVGPGQEQHLPHEAWHVVQQKQGRVKPTLQMKDKVNINDDDKLEKEADVMGRKALQLKNSNQGAQLFNHLHDAGAQNRYGVAQLAAPQPVSADNTGFMDDYHDPNVADVRFKKIGGGQYLLNGKIIKWDDPNYKNLAGEVINLNDANGVAEPDSDVLDVTQGEIGYLANNNGALKKIRSVNASPCVIASIYDSVTHATMMVHIHRKNLVSNFVATAVEKFGENNINLKVSLTTLQFVHAIAAKQEEERTAQQQIINQLKQLIPASLNGVEEDEIVVSTANENAQINSADGALSHPANEAVEASRGHMGMKRGMAYEVGFADAQDNSQNFKPLRTANVMAADEAALQPKAISASGLLSANPLQLKQTETPGGLFDDFLGAIVKKTETGNEILDNEVYRLEENSGDSWYYVSVNGKDYYNKISTAVVSLANLRTDVLIKNGNPADKVKREIDLNDGNGPLDLHIDHSLKYVIFENHADSKTEHLAHQLGLTWLDEGGHIFNGELDDQLQKAYQEVYEVNYKETILGQKSDGHQLPLEDLTAKDLMIFHLAAYQISKEQPNSVQVVKAVREYFSLKVLADTLAIFGNRVLQQALPVPGEALGQVNNSSSDHQIGTNAYQNPRAYLDLFTGLIRGIANLKLGGAAAADPHNRNALKGLRENREEQYMRGESLINHDSTGDINTLRESYMAKNIIAARSPVLVRVGELHRRGLMSRLGEESNIVYLKDYNDFINRLM